MITYTDRLYKRELTFNFFTKLWLIIIELPFMLSILLYCYKLPMTADQNEVINIPDKWSRTNFLQRNLKPLNFVLKCFFFCCFFCNNSFNRYPHMNRLKMMHRHIVQIWSNANLNQTIRIHECAISREHTPPKTQCNE